MLSRWGHQCDVLLLLLLLLQVGKPKARGHRAYTQGVCSHICGAFISLQPITHSSYTCMHSLPRMSTPLYPGPLACQQRNTIVGDVEGILQEYPELGRQSQTNTFVMYDHRGERKTRRIQVTLCSSCWEESYQSCLQLCPYPLTRIFSKEECFIF